MLIENPEVFKSWLTRILEPLCEADPAALAKYVYALVKKDKPIETLREEILDQLDVFLQSETKSFVEELFTSLETNEYLKVGENNLIVQPSKESQESSLIDNKPLIDDEFADAMESSSMLINMCPVNADSTSTTELQFDRFKPIIQVSTLPNLTDSLLNDDKENLQKDGERKAAKERVKMTSTRHRSSRSRSKDRLRRSRSRDRKDSRNKVYRQRSPRRHEKRRSRSPSTVTRYRSRSKSPRIIGHRGRHRFRTVSRSKSPSYDGRLNLKRSRSVSPQINNDLNVCDAQNALTSDVKKKRCRDYETRGYCVRGNLCLYDHGLDAVVITNPSALGYGPNAFPGLAEDALMSTMILSNPQRFPPRLIGHEYNPASPGMWQRNAFRSAPPRAQQMIMTQPPYPTNHPAPSMMQRELINVTVLDNNDGHPDSAIGPAPGLQATFQYQLPQTQTHDTSSNYKSMFFAPNKKKHFDFNRLGPKKYSTNCSLELKKIPIHFNNISHLNNHFAKFGKIVNIQVSYEGDPESALITFSSHNEANFAYKSTEPILNNRFIKVFWHKGNETKPDTLRPEENQQSVEQSQKSDAATGTVENEIKAAADQTVLHCQPFYKKQSKLPQNATNATTVTTTLPSTDKLVKINTPRLLETKNNEILAAKENIKKLQNEKQKEAIKLSQDLRKRKQDLLDKQLAQQKLLLERLEKPNLSETQRDNLIKTIKTLQESVENIRKDLVSQIPENIIAKKPTKEETQKAVLDMELELISKQQEGQDITNLEKTLNHLKMQAGILLNRKPSMFSLPNMKLINKPGGGPGGSNAIITKKVMRFPSRSALSKNNMITKKIPVIKKSKYVLNNNVVDNRPARLVISGFEFDDCDAVLSHFKQFGIIEDHVVDKTTPSLIVNYKSRRDGEVALVRGKMFQDRVLSINWLSSAHMISNQYETLKKMIQKSEAKSKVVNNVNSNTTSSNQVSSSIDGNKVIGGASVKIEPKIDNGVLSNNDHKVKEEPIDVMAAVEEDVDTEVNDIIGDKYSEEVLLQDDEDDDDESTDRSWKR